MAADVLLCNPYFVRDDPVTRQAMDIYPLLGHGYLASYLDARGFGVDSFDATFDADFRGYLHALDSSKPRIVGIYGHVISRRNAFAFAGAAKERGYFVVGGGPDATGYCRDYLDAGFDLIVRSEGEETAAEVLEWHRSGGEWDQLAKIAGVAYRERGAAGATGTRAVERSGDSSGDGIVTTPLRPFIADVDSLPFPRRDGHIYDRYVEAWRAHHGYVSMAIFGARGCPYDCAFCYRPVFGRNYRRRSPANIVDEIQECVDRFGAAHFRFVDDTFVVSKPWVRELSRLVRDRGLRVSFDVLARTNLINDEVAEDLKLMGVRRIYYGMESGSDAVLTRMSKRLDVEDSLRAAEITHRYGMEFLSWVMLGYPGEEKSDIYRTRDLIVRTKPDILSISVAFPIRGTAFHDEVRDRISTKRPLWRRTGENRMVWQGRYPDIFYAFARRWLQKESQLARRAHLRWTRPVHLALRSGYRAGMEAASIWRRRDGRSSRRARGDRASRAGVARAGGGARVDGRGRALTHGTADNLSNRTRGGAAYD